MFGLNTDMATNVPVTCVFFCNEIAYAAGPLDDQDKVKMKRSSI